MERRKIEADQGPLELVGLVGPQFAGRVKNWKCCPTLPGYRHDFDKAQKKRVWTEAKQREGWGNEIVVQRDGQTFVETPVLTTAMAMSTFIEKVWHGEEQWKMFSQAHLYKLFRSCGQRSAKQLLWIGVQEAISEDR